MYKTVREEEYMELMVAISEKSEEELCAIVESGRVNDIITGYLVLLLHRMGINIEKVRREDIDFLLGRVSAREAQILGKIYENPLTTAKIRNTLF